MLPRSAVRPDNPHASLEPGHSYSKDLEDQGHDNETLSRLEIESHRVRAPPPSHRQEAHPRVPYQDHSVLNVDQSHLDTLYPDNLEDTVHTDVWPPEYPSSLATMQSKLEQADVERRVFTSQIAVLNSTISELKKKVEVATRTNTELTSECANYQKRIRDLLAQAQDKVEGNFEVSALRSRLEFHEKDLEHALQRNEDLDLQVSKLTLELDAAQTALQKQQKQHKLTMESRLKGSTTELSTLRTTNMQLESAVENLRQRVDNLQQELISKTCNVSEHGALKDNLALSESRTRDLQDQVAETRAVQQQCQLDLAEAKVRNESLQHENDQLRQKLAVMTTTVVRLQEENSSRDLLIGTAASEPPHGPDLSELHMLLKQSHRERQSVELMYQEEKNARKALMQQLQQLKQETDEQKNAEHALKSEVTTLRSELLAVEEELHNNRAHAKEHVRSDIERLVSTNDGSVDERLSQLVASQKRMERQQLDLYRELASLHTAKSVIEVHFEKFKSNEHAQLQKECQSFAARTLVSETLATILAIENTDLVDEVHQLENARIGLLQVNLSLEEELPSTPRRVNMKTLGRDVGLKVQELSLNNRKLEAALQELESRYNDVLPYKKRYSFLDEELGKQAALSAEYKRKIDELKVDLDLSREYSKDLERQLQLTKSPFSTTSGNDPPKPLSDKTRKSKRLFSGAPMSKQGSSPALELLPLSPVGKHPKNPSQIQNGLPLLELDAPGRDSTDFGSLSHRSSTSAVRSPYSEEVSELLLESSRVLNSPHSEPLDLTPRVDAIPPDSCDDLVRDSVNQPNSSQGGISLVDQELDRRLRDALDTINVLEQELDQRKDEIAKVNKLEYWIRKQSNSFSVIERGLAGIISRLTELTGYSRAPNYVADLEQAVAETISSLSSMHQKAKVMAQPFSHSLAGEEYDNLLEQMTLELRKLRFAQQKVQEERLEMRKYTSTGSRV